MLSGFRTKSSLLLLVVLFFSAGIARAGIEPSPFSVPLASGYDNPIFWVLFNPQPEPPGSEMVGMFLDSSDPIAPTFMVRNDSHGLFHLEFGMENASSPFHAFQYVHYGNGLRVSVLGAAGPLYIVDFSFASGGGFLMPGSDVMFNPQPEPPGLPGFVMKFSLAGGPSFGDGSEVAMTLRLSLPNGQPIAVHPVPEPCSLTYLAGPHGSLLGDTSQLVEPGADGTAVTAEGDPGYAFMRWSDGSTANPRTDTNVTADVTVTAEFALSDYYVDDNGNDANSGTSPVAPMQHLQALLDRYPDIGARCTVHMAPGVYPENVHLGGNHGGLLVEGAGDGASPATATHLIGQGGALNLDVLLVTAGGLDAANPTTIRSLRVSSPGGLGTDSDPNAPFYGGIALDATPVGLLPHIRLLDVTATAVTGLGTGCGILINGLSASTDLVSDVTLDGIAASGNGHAGILLCNTLTDNLSLGGSLPSTIWQNGGPGLVLRAEPTQPGQFAPFAIANTSFYSNGGYDIELRDADTDIDATSGCVFIGAATLAEIEARIWHESDDLALGLVNFGMPVLGGNRLAWNPSTQRFALNGMNLAVGEFWYNLGAPAGAQARIQVVSRTGALSALVKAVDLTGGDHADAVAMVDINELYFRWTLRSGSLAVLNETSVVGKSVVFAAYDSRRNTTLVGRTASPGVWLYSHLILSSADLVREYTRP